MGSMRDFVAALSLKEMQDIHTSYANFERDGFIGDEPCRVQARIFCEQQGMPNQNPVLWMRELAFEVYRRLALCSL